MVSNMELKRSTFGQPSAEQVGEYVAQKVGAANLAALRSMKAEKLSEAAFAAGYDPQATIDGWVLPRQIVDAFDRGEQARVPMIAGFNAGEVRSLRFFLPPLPKKAADYESMVRHILAISPQNLQLYPATDIEESALASARDAFYGWSASAWCASKHNSVCRHTFTSSRTTTRRRMRCISRPFTAASCRLNLASSVRTAIRLTGQSHPITLPSVRSQPRSWVISRASLEPENRSRRASQRGSRLSRGANSRYSRRAACLQGILPGTYALHEEVIARRRASGKQNWYINVGLLSPVVPPAPSPTRSTSGSDHP